MMINLINIGFDIGNLTINAFNTIIESDIILNYDNVDLSDLDSYLKDKEIIRGVDLDSLEAIEEDIESIKDGEVDSDSTEENPNSNVLNAYYKLNEYYSKIEYAISKSFDNNVTIIYSNDSNLFGLNNLLIQMSSKYEDVELKIYPGVSSIDYCSSILGAPFNDFAVIDLNNPIVSPRELRNKIRNSLKNNLVLFIYNIKGKSPFINDNNNFNELEKIVNKFNDELLVGIVKNDYSYEICKFKDIEEEKLDDDSILVIGNKLTYELEGHMVTSCDYIIKPKFISQNMDFFERYLRDETPKGIDYDCDYLPCHKELETCDYCYCPFYPCVDALTGGEWIKGKDIWSCQFCDWVHLETPSQEIRKGLKKILKEPDDLKTKHLELLKLRRECLLKTLK